MGESKHPDKSGAAAPERLQVAVASASELCELFEKQLVRRALFVPTLAALPAGQPVQVELLFKFCKARIVCAGQVIAALPEGVRRTGATPGLSVQLGETVEQLRQRIEASTGTELPDPTRPQPGDRRASPRFPARSNLLIETGGRSYPAEAADISCNGVLALLPGIDLGEGSEVDVRIEHPRSGEAIDLHGRVANQTPCDHGVMAVGIQFLYDFDRIDEVAEFVDDLRSFHAARTLATVTGSLGEQRLETILETFASVASAGTLRLVSGELQGKLMYRDGEIVSVTTGLVSGVKALGRMFTWRDAEFEFEPEIEAVDNDHAPLPLQSALLAAAVERDELAHLDLGRFDPDLGFEVDEALLEAVAPELGDLSREVAENAALGFPLGALLDILTASDVQIYKALAELIEGGVLRIAAA